MPAKEKWLTDSAYYFWRLKNYGITLHFYHKFMHASVYLSNFVESVNDSTVCNTFAAEKGAPINRQYSNKRQHRSFVKLHAMRAYDIYDFSRKDFKNQQNNYSKDEVSHKRTRALFINKFTVHGYKARSQKMYARALKTLQIKYLNKISLPYLFMQVSFMKTLFFSKKNFTFSMKKFYAQYHYNRKYLFKLSKFGLKLQFNFDWENTDAVFSMMARWAPQRALVVNKVSKIVYKNTRGKSGHYSATIKYISPERRFGYMQRYFKQTWQFSTKHSFYQKYIDVLYGAMIEPKLSLGYVYNRFEKDGSNTLN